MVLYKKIYSKKVFTQLLTKGHPLLWIEPNKNNERLSVFVFELSDNLLKDLTEITNK